jgi:hypothetical protein
MLPSSITSLSAFLMPLCFTSKLFLISVLFSPRDPYDDIVHTTFEIIFGASKGNNATVGASEEIVSYSKRRNLIFENQYHQIDLMQELYGSVWYRMNVTLCRACDLKQCAL